MHGAAVTGGEERFDIILVTAKAVARKMTNARPQLNGRVPLDQARANLQIAKKSTRKKTRTVAAAFMFLKWSDRCSQDRETRLRFTIESMATAHFDRNAAIPVTDLVH